jgi:hypothetical protein
MEEFNLFWTSYPRKTKKGDAYKAWQQTESIRPPVDKILDKLKSLKRCEQWRKDGGVFIPYPATWLRAWGWDDETEIDLKVIEHCQVCKKEATHNTPNGWTCSEHYYDVMKPRLVKNA